MALATEIFTFLALSQLATLALYFATNHGKSLLGLLFLFLCFCLAGYLLGGYPSFESDPTYYFIFGRIGNLAPIILYAIAHSLFEDHKRVPAINWVLGVYCVLGRVIGTQYYSPDLENSTAVLFLVILIPHFILLYFSVTAILIAIRGYTPDLVERRRKFRVYFVISVAIFLILRLGTGLVIFEDPFLDRIALLSIPPLPNFVFPAYVFALGLLFNLANFRMHDELFDLFTKEPRQAPDALKQKAADEENEKVASEIARQMEENQLFCRRRISIAEFATELSIPEHRLRKVINKEMNFRNFNQFLNHYRLAEATKRLRETSLPISTIALDVGYSTLSSFNSVFKNQYGITPTEFRTGESAGTELRESHEATA